MTSSNTNRRHLKRLVAKREREQRTDQAIGAADHYTAADRAAAEALEAAQMLAAVIAEEMR